MLVDRMNTYMKVGKRFTLLTQIYLMLMNYLILLMNCLPYATVFLQNRIYCKLLIYQSQFLNFIFALFIQLNFKPRVLYFYKDINKQITKYVIVFFFFTIWYNFIFDLIFLVFSLYSK